MSDELKARPWWSETGEGVEWTRNDGLVVSLEDRPRRGRLAVAWMLDGTEQLRFFDEVKCRPGETMLGVVLDWVDAHRPREATALKRQRYDVWSRHGRWHWWVEAPGLVDVGTLGVESTREAALEAALGVITSPVAECSAGSATPAERLEESRALEWAIYELARAPWPKEHGVTWFVAARSVLADRLAVLASKLDGGEE